MKKQFFRHFSFFACILTLVVFATACSNSAPTNGGIPTEEQRSAAIEALDSDVSSLGFWVDGVTYQFPMYVSDLTDNGWAFDSSTKSELKTLPANTLVAPAVAMRKKANDGYGATACAVQPVNKSTSETTLEDARLYSLKFSKSDAPTLVLPSGITWDSTFAEVKDACKHKTAVDQNGIKYIQVKGDDSSYTVTINFDAATDTITSIEYQGRL